MLTAVLDCRQPGPSPDITASSDCCCQAACGKNPASSHLAHTLVYLPSAAVGGGLLPRKGRELPGPACGTEDNADNKSAVLPRAMHTRFPREWQLSRDTTRPHNCLALSCWKARVKHRIQLMWRAQAAGRTGR